MQLQIHSLSKRGFQRLENFCDRTDIKIKYRLDANVDDLYDVTIQSIESRAILRTSSVFEDEEVITLQAIHSECEISIDSSEFHKVVII